MLELGLISIMGMPDSPGLDCKCVRGDGELVHNVAGLDLGSRLVADDFSWTVIHFPTAGLFR
jgi:hypothetical protein